MKLFRLFATGKAECSEFRLTTARGFALLTYGVFAEAKPRQKRFELLLVNFHCAYLLHYPVKIVKCVKLCKPRFVQFIAGFFKKNEIKYL